MEKNNNKVFLFQNVKNISWTYSFICFFCNEGIKIYELVALLALLVIFANDLSNDNLYNNVLLLYFGNNLLVLI